MKQQFCGLVFVCLIFLCQARSLPEPTQAGDIEQSPALKASGFSPLTLFRSFSAFLSRIVAVRRTRAILEENKTLANAELEKMRIWVSLCIIGNRLCFVFFLKKTYVFIFCCLFFAGCFRFSFYCIRF